MRRCVKLFRNIYFRPLRKIVFAFFLDVRESAHRTRDDPSDEETK